MNSLDAEVIRLRLQGPIRERLASIRVFAEIDSTNSYLMQSSAPQAGRVSVAITNNQTAGRGRHGKTWQSPAGSGLCLSIAYTFVKQPDDLPSLTLALGLAAICAMEKLGASGVKLKWPNDLVALDGKLAGILTEVHSQSSTAVTVVAGIGVNVDLQDEIALDENASWAGRAIDLKAICAVQPEYDELARQLITEMLQACIDFDAAGFAQAAERWPKHDWLLGREIAVDTNNRRILGIGAGISSGGALLIETPESGVQRVSSGVIVSASVGEANP